MTPAPLLKLGDWLHASCSDHVYGEVTLVGEDAETLIDTDDDAASDDRWGNPSMLQLEVSGDVFLRFVQYRKIGESSPAGKFRYGRSPNGRTMHDGPYITTGDWVYMRTPGNGCYRCAKLFAVARKE